MLNRNALIKQSVKQKNPVSQSIMNISQYYEPEQSSPNMSVQQRPLMIPSIQVLSVSGVGGQEDKYHYNQQNEESMVLSRIQNNGNRSQFEKIIQIEEQQREIQKVAQELIVLRDVVKRLKMSLGVIVQEGDMDFIEGAVMDYKWPEGQEYEQNNFGHSKNQSATLRLSSSLSNCKITPEYKEWIIQYLNKLLSDIRQIKGMFLQRKSTANNLQSNNDHNNFNANNGYNPENKQCGRHMNTKNSSTNQPFFQLVEYQIKCRLIETVLKLCRSKNILTQQQTKKLLNEITITPINTITSNLNTHKLSTLIEKLNTINNTNNINNQYNNNNSNHSIEQLFYKWKTIHDQLEIINIQEIQRFYLQKKKAQKQNYHNNDNGILIIGGSGSGKTTLWLAMAGQKMIKKKIKSKNGEIQNYQAADQEVANKYKTSPFATSCTREPAKLEAPKRYTFPQQLCLIDTAGFEQSRSGQIDIMNTLYTYQTIQEMKKLRIIIVVSEKNIGQRQQQLIKFAKYVGRYFRDYEQVRESILFVLTKFESIKRLRVACDNVLKHVQIDRESNEYKFLKHLQQSIVYKQCIEFKPTQQKIIFEAQYHIDPIEMDSKLKKIYKALLKKFPFHHQYENDYINLQYSKQTRDKLISKRCYLENMIRRLYKEGNNCYRFYLEQLLFLQSKVNKIDIISHGYLSTRDNNRQTDQGAQGLEYSIIQFIQEINSQLVQKFNFLLEDYLKTCDSEILQKILQIRDKCNRIYCQQNSFQGMNNESEDMIDDDDEYHYVLREIVESINGLKTEIQRIVQERVREWAKVMKYKAKWCHDVGNKRWLCAVVNFTKMYFGEQNDNKQLNQEKQKQLKLQQEQQEQLSPENIQHQQQNHLLSSSSLQHTTLIKTLTKTQQKFRTQLTQQLNLINQQITNFLIRQQQQSTQQQIDQMFIKQTVNQMKQAINGFKRLVFYQYLKKEDNEKDYNMGMEENRMGNFNLNNKEKHVNSNNKNKVNNKSPIKNTNNKKHPPNKQNPTKQQLFPKYLLLTPPSDQLITNKNSQFITQTILKILTKQQQQIITNLQLIQQFENNDQQITISLWLEVERFIQKVKMLKQVDDSIGQMAIKIQKRIINRVDNMIRGMVSQLGDVVKRQHDQHIPIIIHNNSNNSINKTLFITNNTFITSPTHNNTNNTHTHTFPILPSTKLYNYLSKLNQLQQFQSFSTFLNFQIKCFELKLKDYSLNLEKQMDKYDEEIGWMKKLIHRGGNGDNGSNPFTHLQIYPQIKLTITHCIQLSQQLKVISHYISQSQSISQLQKIQGIDQEQDYSRDVLRFLNSVFYRHSRFLECEKKSLREEFVDNNKLNSNNIYEKFSNNNKSYNNNNNNSNNNSNTLSQLLLDYLILQQTHVQLIKSTHSHYHRTLLQTYQKSYQSLSINQLPSSSQVNGHFHTLITTQVKLLNENKQKILQKLISYPLELLQPILQQIQTQQFHKKLDTNVIQKTVSLFIYFTKLRGLFQTIQGMNNQQIIHDYRVIDIDDIMQPLDQLDDTLQQLSNLLITVIQITRLKFMQIKQSLVGVLLDQQMCQLISTYINSWHILIQLNMYLQSSPVCNLQLLEQSLQQLTHYHNITSQLKQFIDRSQSIFYRVSKNIDSIQLEHLQISQLIEQPQSVNQFIKLLKKQAIFLYGQLECYESGSGDKEKKSNIDYRNNNNNNNNYNDNNNDRYNNNNTTTTTIPSTTTMTQVVNKLNQFIKKIQDSENIIDSIWQDQLKQLQSQTNDPKNSLHKLIKLYQQHITKVSIQKTLQYKFVQLKKQQLSDQIKQYLQIPPTQQIVQKGQLLCQQLKNYLQFLKSMRLKMVVAINDMDQIKNIQQMQRLYQKQTSRSQAAQRSQTDMTPSQLRQNFLSVDYVQSKKQNSQRYSVSDIKTSHFGINSNNRVIQRKSAIKKSRQWDQKSNDTNNGRQHRHSTNINMVMDSSFSSVADQWARQLQLQQQYNNNQQQQQQQHAKQYTINNINNNNTIRRQNSKNDSKRNTYHQPKPQLSKSQSQIQFRSSNNIPINNTSNSMIHNINVNNNNNINYDTIVTQSKKNNFNSSSNNNNNNNLSTINNYNNYNKNYNYNKSAKTIQMSSSTPYIYPTNSNRVIPTNSNNFNNNIINTINTVTKQPNQNLNQQRSSIMLNNNINDNKSTININLSSGNNNNNNNNNDGSKFSYSQKYMSHNNNNNNNNTKKYTINGHNRNETSQSLNVQTNNNNNDNNINVNTANMKKSATMLKYAPPTLVYQNNNNNQSQKLLKPTTPMTARTTSNVGLLSPNQTNMNNDGDTISKNGSGRMMTKYKTQKKL